jgi:hypothetical protein
MVSAVSGSVDRMLTLDQPSAMINAALMHSIHLVTLITRYLSVALPFVPATVVPHVGRPVMKPNVPFVGTTRFRDRHMLWMSSRPAAASARFRTKHRHFLTSFGLFAHSIAYLAHTQGVPNIGLFDGAISPSEVLRLLHEISISPGLGHFSHEPGSVNTSPHLLFGLDVNKVVEAVLQGEEARCGGLEGEELSEGWDLVHA